MERDDYRIGVLKGLNASPTEIEELLTYNRNPFNQDNLTRLKLPVADEAFVPVWERYAVEAETRGLFNVLQENLIQLQFPIEAGISESEAYQSATRRGVFSEKLRGDQGVHLERPDTLRLTIYQSPAGNVPLLFTNHRPDFVALIQSLVLRNEPKPIPDSMGAQIVSGYNNWNRIMEYRKNWEVSNPDGDWKEEFGRLIPQKELYQDTFIILSGNGYSGVPAGELGLTENEWRERSVIIRREHECTHYLTRRLFGCMRNNMLDELIADYTGIVKAFGSYRADIFLRFIGLENFLGSRPGGRIDNYRGQPPLSDGAFAILKQLMVQAACNLERFEKQRLKTETNGGASTMIIALTSLTIEELASDTKGCLLQEALLSAIKWYKGGLAESHD